MRKSNRLPLYGTAPASIRLAAAVAATLFISPSAQASVINWSNNAGSTSWTTGSNWIGGSAPADSLTADIARFDQLDYLVQPNAGTTSINGIQIGDGLSSTAPLLVSGISLAIGNSGITMFANAGPATFSAPITLGSAQIWSNGSDALLSLTGSLANNGNLLTVSGSGDTTISNVISGTGGLSKSGTGTLILSGANTYTGLTSISSGILQIGNNDTLLSVGTGNYNIAAGAQLVFARNATPNGLAFVNQSIGGAGDVVFKNQSTGYFTFRTNYTGTLNYTGKTIVNYDAPVAATTWFQRALWLEKDDLLPHATVLDLQAGKVFLRNNNGGGESISGLTGNTGTFITTDQGVSQKVNISVPDGATYTFNGVIGIDASPIPIQGINDGNITLTKSGAGTQILTGANSYAGGTVIRDGTLVLSGANTLNGPTNVLGGALVISGAIAGSGSITVEAGTLSLDYTNLNASKIDSNSPLSLGGGNVQIIPNNSADTVQNIGSLMLTSGASTITLNKSGGANNAAFNLHSIARTAGTALNVVYGGAGTGLASVTTDNLNTNGILGGWAILNGADWAVNATNSIGGRIAPLAPAGYTGNSWAAGNQTDVTGNSAPAAGSRTETLRFNASSPSTVTLAGTNTIESGGILITAAVGNNGSIIDGGILQPGSGGELLIHQYNSANSLTISSVIADNGTAAAAVTKTGPGVLILSASNRYTGPTYLFGGTVKISKINSGFEPSAIGASSGGAENLVFNHSTLQYTGLSAETDRGFTVAGAGGTIEIVNAGAVLNFLGTIGGSGGLSKSGAGALILGGASNYTGDTIVSSGTLQIGNNNPATTLNGGSFTVAAGASLIFSRNSDNVAFLSQSISGAGDVVFRNQSSGYFTFRDNYTGRLTYTGKTKVSYDADAGGTWFERTLWLEKDDLLPHSTVLELESGKVYLRNNTAFGETISGLSGGINTRIATDQVAIQKLTVNVPEGQTYAFDGEIGFDPALVTSSASIALTKTGGGIQILSGANTFSGGLQIAEGTLRIGVSTASATAVGSGSVILGTNATNGTLDLNGQTEIINNLAIGAGAAPNNQLIGNSSTSADATLVINNTSDFGGVIRDSVGGGTRKTALSLGGGTLVLSNASTYSGNTNVMAGKLVLKAGSSLGNTAITISNGAGISPNPGAGSVNAIGTLSLENGSTFDMTDGQIGLFNLGGAGTALLIGSQAGAGARLNFDLSAAGSDRLNVVNSAAVTGTNTIGISLLGSSLTASKTYTLISAGNGLAGNFQFPNGSQEISVLLGTTTYRLVLANSGTAETVLVLSGSLGSWAGAGSTTNTTTWATASNWSGGAVPGALGTNTSSDTVVFNSNPANPAPIVDAGRNIQNIIFDTANVGSLNIGGSALTLTAGGSIQTTASVTTKQTISAPLILQGDYRILSGSAAGAVVNLTGDLHTAAVGTLMLGGNNSGLNSISGQISDGAAPLGITKSDTGKWVLSNAANSYTGPVTLSGGTLQVNSIGLGATPSPLGASTNAAENLVFNGGTLQYTGPSAASDRAFTINASGATIDIVSADSILTFQGAGTGPGGINKSGAGTLILAGVNSYGGTTTVSGGTLQLGDTKLAGALESGNFSVAAGATLAFARNNDNAAFFTQSISGAGDILFTGQSRGYFTWRTDYTGNLTYTGRTIVNYDADSGGTWFERGFWLEKDNLLPHGTVLDVQSAKVFLRNNTLSGETIGGLEGSGGTFITTDRAEMQKLTFDVAAGQSYRYDGVIGIDNSSAPIEGINAGNIALFKNGPGKQILAGANTYSGATTVNGGTLAISGSISGASTVVGSGAILASGLTGSVQTATGGNIAINHGGSLAPGDIGTAGVLTLNPGLGGKLSFESGSMLQFDIGTGSDLVTFFTPGDWLEGNGNTTLVLNGTINYTRIYTVFENVTTSGFTLAGITGYDASRYFAKFVQSGMDYELSFTAVPEPAATGLLVSGLGLLLGLNRFRRGRRQ